MQIRSPGARTFRYARPVVDCAQCGERIFAPDWSEYLDDHRVRHVWSCLACHYEYETTVVFPPELTPEAA